MYSVRCQPGWEGSLEEYGYMCIYGWVPSLFTWDCHNIVNQLYPSTKCFWCKKNNKQFFYYWSIIALGSARFSCSVVSDSLQSHGLQHARLSCPPPTPGAYSNSCPSCRWCHPTISFSVVPFSCLQSFPASRSFSTSQFFASGGQSIGVSALALVFPMNIQGWFPLGWTGWISLQSKGLLRVFSNTTVQKHQFFGAQLLLWSSSHIHAWLLEKP